MFLLTIFRTGASGSVFSVRFQPGKDRQGLPGDTFELYADGHHEYYDEDGHHHDDTEGLSYQWKIEEGSEYARLEVDQEDSAKALLCLNEDLPVLTPIKLDPVLRQKTN